MSARLLVVVLVVLAAVPSNAGALSLGSVRAALPVAATVAETYWSADACDGRARVALVTTSRLGALRASAGMIDSAPVTADADEATCLTRLAWDSDGVESRAGLCTVLVHERGHLHGLRFANSADPWHSANSRSVMSAGFSGVVPECMRAFVPRSVKRLARLGWSCAARPEMAAWRCRRAHRRALFVATT